MPFIKLELFFLMFPFFCWFLFLQSATFGHVLISWAGDLQELRKSAGEEPNEKLALAAID
jgi:hypothetical protein